MQEDLATIKNKYGEKFSHLCRSLFPTILENKGILPNLLEVSFAPNKFLYDDLIRTDSVYKFKDYIYSLYDVEKNEIVTDKSPEELLNEKGYVLYECHSEEDIKKFSKYYAPNEELCTFYDENRLDRCYVFFAVRKDVDNIKREDYSHPERQDAYGTSVISIQFTKGAVNTLSIKNRYNHRVNNPDATFNNNLDNINKGLTTSFEKKYNLRVNSYDNKMYLPGYVLANDGRFYKYNYEINNIYYGTDNIIVDNFSVINKYSKDKARYIVLDYFILDLKEKKIIKYDDKVSDSFVDGIVNIDKIEVRKTSDSNKHIFIESNGNNIEIIINNTNEIIGYKNNGLEKIGDNFLKENVSLQHLEMKNVKSIGDRFLYRNNSSLEYADLNGVKEIGDYFMFSNTSLKNLCMSNVKHFGDNCMYYSQAEQLFLSNLESVGNNFLRFDANLVEFVAPDLSNAGSGLLEHFSPIYESDFIVNPALKNKFPYLNFHSDEVKEEKGRGSL